jgi:hypothetical protein
MPTTVGRRSRVGARRDIRGGAGIFSSGLTPVVASIAGVSIDGVAGVHAVGIGSVDGGVGRGVAGVGRVNVLGVAGVSSTGVLRALVLNRPGMGRKEVAPYDSESQD